MRREGRTEQQAEAQAVAGTWGFPAGSADPFWVVWEDRRHETVRTGAKRKKAPHRAEGTNHDGGARRAFWASYPFLWVHEREPVRVPTREAETCLNKGAGLEPLGLREETVQDP